MGMIGEVSGETLAGHVRQLVACGPRHRSNLAAVRATREYLAGTLEQWGFRVRAERWGDQEHQWNVLAEVAGADPAAVLDVGAHWDSVRDSPGADDNASGVAAVLEAARVLRAAAPLALPVRFCLFGGEEGDEHDARDAPGGGDLWAAGSRAHVSAGGAVPAIAGAFVLEMIGCRRRETGSQRLPADVLALAPDLARYDRGDFIAAVGNPPAGRLLSALQLAGQQRTPLLQVLTLAVPGGASPNAMRSDHSSYWAAGHPAVMITDTAEFRNEHYHRPSDTLESLDLDFAADVTQTLIRAVQGLAG
jgi:Peptidase family M28